MGLEWNVQVVRAVSPDGDGSHLHPLTRCKSAFVYLPTVQIWSWSDSPIHRSKHTHPPSRVGRRRRILLNVPRLWRVHKPGYKRTSTTLPWLFTSRVISPLPTRSRLLMCTPGMHSSSPQILHHHSLHAFACMCPLRPPCPIHHFFFGIYKSTVAPRIAVKSASSQIYLRCVTPFPRVIPHLDLDACTFDSSSSWSSITAPQSSPE